MSNTDSLIKRVLQYGKHGISTGAILIQLLEFKRYGLKESFLIYSQQYGSLEVAVNYYIKDTFFEYFDLETSPSILIEKINALPDILQ